MLRIYTIYPFASNNDAYPQTATMAAKPPTRLAILMADTPMPNTAAKYGDYGGLFTSLFTTAAQPEPIESILSITKHDIVNHVGSYPSLDDVDAVLITGSKHSAFADDAWIMALVDYTRRALLETNGRVKVVGICFGHQIVARALGGKVVVNEKGWEVAVTEVELTERAREFFGLETLVSLSCCDCGGSRGEWNRSAVRLTMLPFFPVDLENPPNAPRHRPGVAQDGPSHHALGLQQRLPGPGDALARPLCYGSGSSGVYRGGCARGLGDQARRRHPP